jgi:branched-chain amino acid transport system substrate-binding protein
MKSWTWKLVLAAWLVLGWPPATQAEPARLKLGFIGGLSGPGQVFGISGRNGILLAQRAKEAQGLEIIFEDDQFIPAKTVSAYRKLVDQDKVDLITVIGSTLANAIAPLAEREGVPLLACASDSAIDRGRNKVVRIWPSGEAEGGKIAEEAARRRLLKVGWISYADDYSRAATDGFRRRFGGRIELSNEVPQDEKDFRAFLLKARVLGLAGLGACLATGQIALFSKQALELGLKAPLFGCVTLDNKAEFKNFAPGQIQGWYVTEGIADWFRAEYLKSFGNEDAVSIAAVFYDVISILAVLNQGGARGQELIRELGRVDNRTGAVRRLSAGFKGTQQALEGELVVREIGDLIRAGLETYAIPID